MGVGAARQSLRVANRRTGGDPARLGSGRARQALSILTRLPTGCGRLNLLDCSGQLRRRQDQTGPCGGYGLLYSPTG